MDASPLRPFVFASSSRDTTVRVWTMQSYVMDTCFALMCHKLSPGILDVVVAGSNEPLELVTPKRLGLELKVRIGVRVRIRMRVLLELNVAE